MNKGHHIINGGHFILLYNFNLLIEVVLSVHCEQISIGIISVLLDTTAPPNVYYMDISTMIILDDWLA